jgi:hypothetical protein
MEIDVNNPPAIIPMRGFKVELGGSVSSDVNQYQLEQEEKHMYFYKTHFLNEGRRNVVNQPYKFRTYQFRWWNTCRTLYHFRTLYEPSKFRKEVQNHHFKGKEDIS